MTVDLGKAEENYVTESLMKLGTRMKARSENRKVKRNDIN